MKEKIYKFMQGRYGAYGPDSLSKFLFALIIICLILPIVTGLGIFYYTGLILIFCYYYRFLSRKYEKRYRENAIYLHLTAGIRKLFSRIKAHHNIRKTHHIYSCPQCKQKIRIPKGKGMIMVKCPKCHNEFKRKS